MKNQQVEWIDFKLEQFEHLIPESGPSSTIEGEMLRAIQRILYRYFNDGDTFLNGYGRETVGNSVEWLREESPLAEKLYEIFSSVKKPSPGEYEYTDKDKYADMIYRAAEEIVKYVEYRNGQYEPNLDQDSR